MIGNFNMKKRNTLLALACGLVLGSTLTLCLGAAAKARETSKHDWSRLHVVAYPSGGTGYFDPDSGTLYVYDANQQNCYLIRRLTSLGEPMIRP